MLLYVYSFSLSACMRPMYMYTLSFFHSCSDAWYKQHLRTAGWESEDEGILPPKHPQSDWSLHRCRPRPLYCDAIYVNGKSATVSEKGATTLYHCRGCRAWAGQSHSHTILILMTPWFLFQFQNIFFNQCVEMSKLLSEYYHHGPRKLSVGNYFPKEREILAT